MNKAEVSKFYQNYRLYIFPVIVGLSSLILIIFVIYPQTVKLITSQKVQTETISKAGFLATKVQALESYDSTDLKLKEELALNSYPADKDFVSALSLLQNLTAQSGFNTISIALGSDAYKGSNAKSYNIKLDILGPSALLPILLSNIESSTRLMRVSSVETSVGKDQIATISLNVDVLFSSAPAGFGSVDSPLPSLSQEDEEVIAKLARTRTPVAPQQTTVGPLGPRGKANPFE